MPDMYPGLYISAGYSMTDIDMLKKEVATDIMEKAGFLSADGATDIAARLQIAFERVLPQVCLVITWKQFEQLQDIQCRLVLLPEMSEPGSAFLRVEWYGMNLLLNHTKTQWHNGAAEKV